MFTVIPVLILVALVIVWSGVKIVPQGYPFETIQTIEKGYINTDSYLFSELKQLTG